MSDTAETGSAPRGGAVHWLVRIAERAGHGDKERPEIEAGSGTPAAWTEVTRAYGISDSELSALVANYFRLEVANFAESDPNAALLIPETMARKHLVFPLVEDDRRFVVATCDPTNVEAERALGFTTGRTSLFQVAAPGAIQEALDARFSPERVVETLLGGIGDEIDDDAVKLVEEMGPEAISEDDAGATPVIRLTSLIIRDAITQAASDIHIEPGRKLGAVRYRVDGVLRKHMDLPMAAFNRVISRPRLQQAIEQRKSRSTLTRLAQQGGMRTLHEVGLEWVVQGKTTLVEVERVLGQDIADGTSDEAVGPPRILLVDDDEDACLLMRSLLERDGYQVDDAEDGNRALDILKEDQDYQLLVLDLAMPGLDGRQVLDQIRGSVDTAALPVLIRTATGFDELEAELLEAGADDYVEKSVDADRFMARVHAVLRRAL